jgi:hypothetical protein
MKAATTSSHRVIGYAPVLISAEARNSLYAFKEAQMPVDLRIERSMVSAAVQLVIENEELKTELIKRAHAMLKLEDQQEGMPMTGMLPGYRPVLIRIGVKEQVRYLASAESISMNHRQAERVLVTEAIGLVLEAPRLHPTWVELIAKTVGWEVDNCFQRTKAMA